MNILLFIFSFLFTACQEQKSTRTLSSFAPGKELAAPENFNETDLGLAYNICLALRTKDASYRAERVGHKFHFSLEHKNCDNNIVEADLTTELQAPTADGAMVFQSLSGANQMFGNFYFHGVETHKHGIFSYICPQTGSGGDIVNTYTTPEGQIQIYLQKEGQLGVATSVLANEATTGENKGKVITERTEILKVYLGSGIPSKDVGVIKIRKQTIPCSNGITEIFTQTLLHEQD